MTEWLKDCDICNVGLCKRMTELTASIEKGGKGLSEREAARIMESEAADQIGEKVWSAKQIEARYRYHTGKDKSVRNSDTQTQKNQEVKVQKVEKLRKTKPNPVVEEPEVDPELSRWGMILSAATNIHTFTLEAAFPVEHTQYAEKALEKILEILPALKVAIMRDKQFSEMKKIGEAALKKYITRRKGSSPVEQKFIDAALGRKARPKALERVRKQMEEQWEKELSKATKTPKAEGNRRGANVKVPGQRPKQNRMRKS